MKILSVTLLLALSINILHSQENKPYSFAKKIDLPGDGKWDYMSVDDEHHLLYVSHADRVHIIDLTTDKPIAEWTSLANVHGISFGKKNNKVYIANTAENNVLVFDAITRKQLTKVSLEGAKKPDCILFDEHSQKAFVFCGKSNNAYVIDGASDRVIAQFDVGGKPEFACTDNTGFIYNNLEDKNEVVVIDTKKNLIVNRFSLGDNKAPTGIAIDIKNDRLMVACEESEKMVVLSKTSGKIIATVPIGKKTDGIVYVKEKGLIITSNGAGSATVIKQESADHYSVIQTINTKPGLKTIACEEKTNRFFETGADFHKDGKTILPGSFGVYVYSYKK